MIFFIRVFYSIFLFNFSTATKGNRSKTELSLPNRASVMLELCDAYIQMKKPDEANEIMERAMTEFQVRI